MTNEEITATYADLSADEAFEAFDAAMVDNATIAAVLCEEAEREYASWQYFNLK